MINKFELKYSLNFYNDINAIVSYIKNELNNIVAANNILNKIEKELLIRLQNPLNYEQYKTPSGKIYYKIYINNYIIFYTVNDNVMEVRRLLYKKRNFKEIL